MSCFGFSSLLSKRKRSLFSLSHHPCLHPEVCPFITRALSCSIKHVIFTHKQNSSFVTLLCTPETKRVITPCIESGFPGAMHFTRQEYTLPRSAPNCCPDSIQNLPQRGIRHHVAQRGSRSQNGTNTKYSRIVSDGIRARRNLTNCLAQLFPCFKEETEGK